MSPVSRVGDVLSADRPRRTARSATATYRPSISRSTLCSFQSETRTPPMSKQIEIVQSDSRQQAESSANNRIDEYEADGFELADQEVALGPNGVTLLLVFETAE